MKNLINNIKENIRRVTLILGFLTILIVPTDTYATHIVGGNLTYKHVIGDVYQVRLVLRRDCFLGSPEAEFDDPASIGIFTAGGALAGWLANNGQLKLKFMNSDTLNEYIQSDCGFEGTQVCVHETIYQGNLTLPFREGGYILAYQRCCRNASLNNVPDPTEVGSTYFINVTEKSMQLKNSSPTFNSWPDVYICANKPLVFDHSAKDLNGDSLVYKLCSPSLGGTKINNKPQPPNFPPYSDIFWAPPYSLNDMMGGVPLKINSKTGEITATPNLVGQFLIGICVEEYRNGVLLSSVRRDFQYNVRVCSQPPKAKFTTSESNCDGLTVKFFNESLSSSNFKWDFNFPSTDTIFKSTLKDPEFTFPQSGVYKVVLRATRGSDGCFDTILQTVSVFNNKIIPDFSFVLDGCEEGVDTLKVKLLDISSFDEPGYAIDNWEWLITQNGMTKTYTGKTPVIGISKSGKVDIKLVVSASNGCKSEIIKILNPEDFIPKIDFSYELGGCPSDSTVEILFINKSKLLNPFAIQDSSKWTFKNQVFIGDSLKIRVPLNTTNVSMDLAAHFRTVCVISLEKSFDVNSILPKADYKFDPIECPTDLSVQIRVIYIDTLALNISANTISWSIGTSTDRKNYNGVNLGFIIPKDSLIYLDMVTRFANGCLDNISDTIKPGPFSTIKFSADPIIFCPGEKKTIVLNPNPNWTYTWSPSTGLDLTNPSNPLVSVTENTTYQVTVSDGLCEVVSKVDIIALAGGVVLDILGDTTSCSGKTTLSVVGGIGAGQYTWSTDPGSINVVGTGEMINVSFTGNTQTYYVKFVGDACSTFPASFTVKNQVPKIETVSPFTICKSDTAQVLTLNLVQEHQNTYSWQSNSHIVSGGNTSSPTVGIGANETNDFTLYFDVINQYGCSINDSIIFKIGQNPTVDFDFTLKTCGEYEVCFNIQGTYNGFIRWDFGDTTTMTDVSLIKMPCYKYPSSGVFNVNLQNLVNVCPFKNTQKQITLNPQINIQNIPDMVLCEGDSLILKAVSNLSNVEYTWCNMNGEEIVKGPDLKLLLSQDAQFIIKGKDIYGCTDQDTVKASVFKFEFSIDLKDSLCVNENANVLLNIQNPNDYNYSWSPSECIVSGGNTNKPVILAVDGKTLSVIVVNKQNGCRDTTSITPKVTKAFTFELTGPQIFCFDKTGEVLLNIINPNNYTYNWTPTNIIKSGANTIKPVVEITSNITLKVLVTNILSGCKQDKSIDLKAGEEIDISVDAEPDLTIYEGESVDIFVVDPINNVKYLWSNNQSTSAITVSPIVTTTYTVTVTDLNGCTAVDQVTVTVRVAKCDETDVYIPNAFSPNGDGNNDVFRVRSNFVDEMELIIYNRWGQEVFKSNDINVGWDGSFKGKELPPDAYAFYLRALCVNAIEYKKQGNVSLVR